jgi:hypothetical protein
MQAYSLALDVYQWLLDHIFTVWLLLVLAYLPLIYGRELPYSLNLRIIPRATPIACPAASLCATALLQSGVAGFVGVLLMFREFLDQTRP